MPINNDNQGNQEIVAAILAAALYEKEEPSANPTARIVALQRQVLRTLVAAAEREPA